MNDLEHTRETDRAFLRKAMRVRGYLASDSGIVTGTFLLLNLLRLVSTIVLTRILTPDVFGAIALISSVTFFIFMISDLGFQTFLTRHPQGDEASLRDTVWTIRFVRGLMLTLIVYVTAPFVSRIMDYPELEPLLQVFAFTLCLDAMTSISVVSALRDKRLPTLSLLDIAVAAFQLVASIYLALELRSYWGIVWAIIAAAVLKVVLSFIFFRDSLPRFRIDRSYARELLLFGRFIAASSAITLILSQADKLLLAKVTSLDVLGLYVLAANLSGIAVNFAITYSGRALYPKYAETFNADPSALAAKFNAGDFIQRLYPFGVGFMLGVAPLLIAILYDERYSDTAIYLRVLLVGAVFALANYASNDVLLAKGRVRSTLEANLVRLLWLIGGGTVAYWFYGYWGLICTFATVEIGARLYYYFMLSRTQLFASRGDVLLIALAIVGAMAGWLLSSLVTPLV